MSTKFTIALAIAAGFLGGLVSRNGVPGSVYAKVQPPPPNQTTPSLKEIRTHQFVLVEANGKPRGVFGFETNAERFRDREVNGAGDSDGGWRLYLFPTRVPTNESIWHTSKAKFG